ncbi:MAG: hypothetical protein ACFFD1_07735, partial [Candidatus Thorarchaeota archaeon]
MDPKIAKGLSTLYTSEEPVLIKNIGFTKSLATVLEKIGLVKLSIIQSRSKEVKSPNAASITDLGKAL